MEVFARLGSPHGFLSKIFGISVNFWIDIGEKYFFEKYFRDKIISRRKKLIFFWRKNMIFFEKSKFRKFWKLKFWKFQNFVGFSKLRFSKFSKFRFFKKWHFLSENVFIFFFVAKIFCIEKYFSKNIVHLYQSKNSPRFQKSCLENRAMSLDVRKLQHRKNNSIYKEF